MIGTRLGTGSRHLLGSLIAVVLAAVLLPAATPPRTAAATPPKVVIVVGPSGDATDRYRAEAAEAAAAARRFTAHVVSVLAPDATWPAVRDALQGASIVVYMGHGNGWPSRYRDHLYPPTQNGFGLNPVAGGPDHVHQYFGEARIAEEVRLADDAVVVLSHLCYASGNTEPGLPEGTWQQARQRVENYAAGFAAAGASAVIADGYLQPAWYLRALLGGDRTVEDVWRSAPSSNGRSITFGSARTAGYTAFMDPEREDGGYYRSLVVRGEVRTAAIREGAADEPPVPLVPAVPTLAGAGLELGTPVLAHPPTVGTSSRVRIPWTAGARSALPESLMVAVRWDPLDVPAGDSGTADAEDPAPTVGEREVVRSPAESGGTEPADAGPDPSDELRPPPLVQGETLGSVVAPVRARIGRTHIGARLTVPERPGLYRLVTTLHDVDEIAYDAETQAMVQGLLVRVTAPVGIGWSTPAALDAVAGEVFALRVGVVNEGALPWGRTIHAAHRPGEPSAAVAGVVVARWVPLAADREGDASGEGEGEGDMVDAASAVSASLPPGLEPGDPTAVRLDLTAPTEPGAYLLMLDVAVPGTGSLASAGAGPALVRVTVTGR